MRVIIKTAVRVIIIVMALKLLYAGFNLANTVILYQRYELPLPVYIFVIVLGLFILGVLLLWLLWWKTDWLVKILAGDIDEQELIINTTNLDLFWLAIRILGVYILVGAVSDLFGRVAYQIYIENQLEGLRFLSPEEQAMEISQWIKVVVTVLIGVFLVSGVKGVCRGFCKGVKNFWKRAELSDKGEY
jgi:hypothetical protein